MLIDTHILLWVMQGEPGDMGKQTEMLVRENFADLTVSAASLLEIRLKQRRGGLKETSVELLIDHVKESGACLLTIEPEDVLNILDIEFTNHADPFDLLLVAQAIAHNLKFLTCDAEILKIRHPRLQLIDGRL